MSVNCEASLRRRFRFITLRIAARQQSQRQSADREDRDQLLDADGTDQLDAGGLGTLLLVRRWAVQRCVKLKLVNPPVFFRRMLEATHLSQLFEISSLKEAICILRANESSPARFAIA